MKNIIHKVKSFLSNDTYKDILYLIFIILLIISVAFKIISINANAANEPSEGGGSARITDLTGYTVTVPAGWSASAGYGSFYFEYTIESDYNGPNENMSSLWIGYSLDWMELEFIVQSNSIINYSFTEYQSPETLTINVFGGVDVTNTRLIDWFYDNNATFVNNNVPEPEPEPIIGWSNDESINFFRTPIVQTTPPTVDDYQTIYYYSGWEKPYAILRDNISIDGESFFPIVQYYDTYYEALYYGMDYIEREILTEPVFMDGYEKGKEEGYEKGKEEGYEKGEEEGYEKGKEEGYQNGLSMGESSVIGQNLLGDILSAPIRALDNLVIIDTPSGFTISVWNIFSALIGVSLFIWFLKMFAGG